MAQSRTERRLAALLVADVVDYSRHISADEAGTLAELEIVLSQVIDPACAGHGGRIVKTTGDGLLAEFPSAVDAVRCAMAVQTILADQKGGLRLRIGVNVGDVVVQNGDVLGDGVNIASRLEGAAEPGGIAVSGAVREYLGGRIDEPFRKAERRALKNIDRPIDVWLWSPPGAEAAGRTRAPPLPDKPSIAVLPFDNMSGEPEQDYLADGVSEAITATLSSIRAFFVIARNSAFTYKSRPVNVCAIGRELGVAYLLEGSVQKAGPRLRITVQLVETAEGAHLWAAKYDGALDEVFDLQDRITEQVAGALQPSIRQAEIKRARRKRPQDLGAYDYAMRAMEHVWLLEQEAATRAIKLLDEALRIDPEYPLALALAAWCWAQRAVYNWVADIEGAKARALELADKAAGESDDDPLILAVLGAVHTFARHFGAARVLLERAIMLDPNAAWALSRLGWLDVYADRPEAAREYFERALRLSPLDPMNFNNYVGLASARQVAGDDEGAAELFIRALQERPNAFWVHRNLAPALLGAGRERQAKASCEQLMAAYPNFTVRRFREAMVFSPAMLDRISAQLSTLDVPHG